MATGRASGSISPARRSGWFAPILTLTAAAALAHGTASGAVAQAFPRGVWRIVPGHAIGPVRLEMTSTQVRRVTSSLPCEIATTYAVGRVSRLETNCGVAYQTAEGITVGLDGRRVLWVHGDPEQVVADNRPPGTRADWYVYHGPGIAFRVIHALDGLLIQAIAVFRGTGRPARQPPPGPAPFPIPGGGD